ncbi:hypothetical protein ACEWK1_20030, partial [Metabacillus sp. YM-086]|uniref:hypothetical protein n=1 Tax=Metabacillus sp. YM-086 TaxID=3341729 RepID=UPI003A8A42AB
KLFKRQSKKEVIRVMKEEVQELKDTKEIFVDMRTNIENMQKSVDEMIMRTKFMGLLLDEAKGILKDMREKREQREKEGKSQ